MSATPREEAKSGLLLRPAVDTDIKDILSITKEAFSDYAGRISPPVKIAALMDDAASVALDLVKKRVFVATLEGETVGTIRYEDVGGGLAYISRFGVRMSAQKAGVGRALSHYVDEAAIAEGMTAFALHTASKMMAQMRFYYANGYYVYSTRHDRGYVRALLVKQLDPAEPLPPLDAILDR